eukprot:scaffold36711_cov66-Phaeocystis_antarctica.AAC.1
MHMRMWWPQHGTAAPLGCRSPPAQARLAPYPDGRVCGGAVTTFAARRGAAAVALGSRNLTVAAPGLGRIKDSSCSGAAVGPLPGGGGRW